MTTTRRPVGIGVLGGNSFVAGRAVLPAIEQLGSTHLVAIASRSGPVPERWARAAVADYDDVLAHPDVEAVYLPLPNGLHREWTERAAAAGKHVLCEKPLAPDATTAQAMADACAEAGVLLAEAWMTPFHPRWSEAFRLARAGEIGEIEHQDHRFTFRIVGADDNYRWLRDQGGGALLDVGIYTVGSAVELFGPDATIERVDVTRSDSGVDASFAADLRWPGDRTAHVHCSFVHDEMQRMRFVGTGGELGLDASAFTGGPGDDRITLVDTDGDATGEVVVETRDPYVGMLDAFAAAVRRTAPWPRPVEQAVGLLRLLDRLAEAADG